MSEDCTECFACGEIIEGGEWVIPLKTFKAVYWGGDFALNQDETVETIIHADCLKESVDTGTENSEEGENHV